MVLVAKRMWLPLEAIDQEFIPFICPSAIRFVSLFYSSESPTELYQLLFTESQEARPREDDKMAIYQSLTDCGVFKADAALAPLNVTASSLMIVTLSWWRRHNWIDEIQRAGKPRQDVGKHDYVDGIQIKWVM